LRLVKVIWPAPNRTIGTVDALAIIGLVGLLVARFIPVARLPFWGCTLRETTGWPCLGCGLTRVADRMSHLNIAGAWEANPLGTVAAGLFMLAIVLSVLHLAFKLPLPKLELSPLDRTVLRVGLVVLILVNYGWVVIKAKFPELLQVATG
jgi:Protein of unknown function (DUF2752)